MPAAPKASRSAGAWSTARPARSISRKAKSCSTAAQRAGQRRLAGEAGAAGRGDADERVAPRRHRRQQRGEPGGRVVAGQEVERQAAPGERAGRHRRRLGRGAGERDDERAGRARVLEAVGLGGAGVPGALADPELAVPVAEGEEGEAGGLGPVGRDQRRVAVLAEALHRAVGEADAQRAGGRRGLGHAGGEVAAGPALRAGRGQEDRRPGAISTGAGESSGRTFGGASRAIRSQRSPAARLSWLPGSSHQRRPGSAAIACSAWRSVAGDGRLRVEAVAGDEDVGDAVGAGRGGEAGDAGVAGLAQAAAQVLGEAAEGLAEVQVGGVQEADHAASPRRRARRPAARRGC